MTAATIPQALGSEPEGGARQCMFCAAPLRDRGAGYLEHLAASGPCHVAHEAWLERLGEDRPGG